MRQKCPDIDLVVQKKFDVVSLYLSSSDLNIKKAAKIAKLNSFLQYYSINNEKVDRSRFKMSDEIVEI